MPKSSTKKRRGRGEASVFRRQSDGLWVASVSLGYDGAGRRKRKTVYGATKKEALDRLDAVRSDVRVGLLPDAGNLTVGQILDKWLLSSQAKTAARTYEEREAIARNHLKPRIGGQKLVKLTALHVESLYAEMRADGVGGFAIRSAADALAAALNYAVKLSLIPSSPAARVQKPKRPKTPKHFLNDGQVKALLAASAGAHVRPLLVVALATGCRQGELLALAWDDIDLKNGTLTVRRSLSRTRAGLVLKEPKNTTSRRTIRLPRTAIDELTTLKDAAAKAGRSAAPVFCTRSGGYRDAHNVIKAFRAAVCRANKDTDPPLIPPKVRFHDLRHTVASILLSKGYSLRAVSQRLGHADPAMTLRVYAHVMPNDDAQLADGLDKVLA